MVDGLMGNDVFNNLSVVSRRTDYTLHTVASVIRLSPMGLQSMWNSSQLLGKYVVWRTGVRKTRTNMSR